MAITEQDVALSEGADTDQPEEATTEEPRPGGRSPRERFDALPEDLKDKILDEHRHWNTEHIDWWEGVYEQFKGDMDAIGIQVERMYFSGFWSQGDGACFEGCVFDWELFLNSLGYTDAALTDHATRNFSFSVAHFGHYYHENCTSFGFDTPLPCHNEDEDFIDDYSPHERASLQEAVWIALLSGYSSDSFEREFNEAFKNHMRDLYKRLEQEYDYLTSDEAVLDSLEANYQLEEAINDALETDHA